MQTNTAKASMQKVTKTIDKYGNTLYHNEGDQLHNEEGPAYIGADGAVEYCINGKLHRIDGPAIIWADGDVEYCINGEYLTKEEFEARNNIKKFTPYVQAAIEHALSCEHFKEQYGTFGIEQLQKELQQ